MSKQRYTVIDDAENSDTSSVAPKKQRFTVIDEPNSSSDYEKYLSGEKIFDKGLSYVNSNENKLNTLNRQLDEIESIDNKINPIKGGGLNEGKKQLIRDLYQNGKATQQELKQTIEVLRGVAKNQYNQGYYLDDKGVAHPEVYGQKPPKEYHLASVFGTKEDAKNDSWYTDLLKSGSNAIVGAAEVVVELAQIAHEGVFDKPNSFLQGIINQSEKLKFTKDEDIEAPFFNENGDFSVTPENVWGTVLNVAEFVITSEAYAVKAAVGLKKADWAWKITKEGQKVLSKKGALALAGISSFMSNLHFTSQAADEAGLEGRDGAAYKLAANTVVSGIEMGLGVEPVLNKLIANKVIGKTFEAEKVGFLKETAKTILKKDASGAITKESLDEAAKVLSDSYPNFLKTAVKNILVKEPLEEVTQNIGERGVQILHDFVSGDDTPKFNTELLSREAINSYKNDWFGGMIGALALSPVTRHANKIEKENEKSKTVYGAVLRGDDAVKNFKNNIFAAKEKGDLTEQEAQDAITRINAYKDYNDRVGSLDLNDEQKREVFDLSFQKQNLETQLAQEKRPEKLDPIELAKYKGVEKQADDLQKKINEIVLGGQIKKETVVADKTVDDVLKKEEPKEQPEKPKTTSPLQAMMDKYKAKPKEKDERTYEQVPLEEFNKKTFNSRIKHAITHAFLNSQPNKIAEGKIAKRDFNYKKPNSVFEAELTDGKKIRFSSSQQREDAWKNGHLDNALDETVMKEGKNGYMELDRTKLDGKPIALKAYTITNDGREKNVIKIYNPENGKFIAWAKETHDGKSDYTHEEKNGPGGLIDIERTIEQPPSSSKQETSPTEPTPIIKTGVKLTPQFIKKATKLGFTESQVNEMSAKERNLIREASSKEDVSDLNKKYNKVENKSLPKPQFNLTFITDEKVLKSPMGKESKKTPFGEVIETQTNVGKKQAKLKAEFERLKKLTNCIWG